MSVTFSGAFTFSGGGFTATLAPPATPTATAGWYGGGVTNFVPTPSNKSLVNRLTFATDTSTASIRGPLTDGGYQLAATGTITYGWFGGGYVFPATRYSTVSRITYTTDTATASSRGPLTAAKYGVSASTDSSTYGWFAGGSLPGATSTIDRITFATDTATATARGPLGTALFGQGATGTSSYGWFMGGFSPSAGYVTTIQRIDYANDSATASIRGNLLTGLYRSVGAVTDGSTYGWLGAGRAASPTNSVSTVQRITYATDTGTTSTRGPLTAVAYNGGATSDGATYGWFGMGNTGSLSSIITRITYATDTATSTDRGFLSAVRYGFAGTSGNQ